MTLRKSLLFGAACLVAAAPLAKAQPYYTNPYSQQTYAATPAVPPSWNYDPYTSGAGPCPQRSPNDSLSCSQQMPPTYGQPSYWSR